MASGICGTPHLIPSRLGTTTHIREREGKGAPGALRSIPPRPHQTLAPQRWLVGAPPAGVQYGNGVPPEPSAGWPAWAPTPCARAPYAPARPSTTSCPWGTSPASRACRVRGPPGCPPVVLARTPRLRTQRPGTRPSIALSVPAK